MNHEPRTLIVGIDPGVDGGIAGIRATDGALVFAIPMPVATKVVNGENRRYVPVERLRGPASDHRIREMWTEAVHGWGGENAKSATSLVRSQAVCVGAFGMFSPVHEVQPAIWKKALGLPSAETATERKALAVALARRFFPEHANTTFRLAGSDGWAEAALIATYGREQTLAASA